MTHTAGMIVDRGSGLPPAARCINRIGPFQEEAIPAGLFGNHRLPADTWAVLQIAAGNIRFHWDDHEGGQHVLKAPCSLLIPPLTPHHLVSLGPVTLSISFWR